MTLTELPSILKSDSFGCVYLTGHRITLEQFLWYYQNGSSPEALREQFPTLPMGLIHQVLGFYWDRLVEVDEYLTTARAELERQRNSGDKVDRESLRKRWALREAMMPAKAG